MTYVNECNMNLLPRLVSACIPLLRAENMAQNEEDSWDHVRVLFEEFDALLSEFVCDEPYRRYEVESIVRKRASDI